MDLYSNMEEDFIVVTPSEAGEPPLEYCAQDESRPKLFGVWGALMPVGKAVTSLLSSFLDSHKKGTTMNNVTVEEVSPPRHECAPANETQESESNLKPDSHAKRRKSLIRSKAISSASEIETEYSFHRFKLNSKDNSTDDYFVLKVKARSTSSLSSGLISPTTENQSLQNLAETLYKNDSGIPEEVEKDSPAMLEFEQAFFNQDSPVIIRRGSGMSNKKSISLPSRTDIVSPDSLISVNWAHARGSLQPTTNLCSNGHILESTTSEKRLSEQAIKDIVKIHCDDFVKYSNWNTLLPYLEAAELLDPDTKDKLMNHYLGEHEKSLFFYLTALPSQGKAAYTTFYKCLMQEKEHAGHKTLQEYFNPFS